MNTQTAILAGAAVAVVVWLALPRARGLLRLVPLVALVIMAASAFVSISLPPFALSFLTGAGAAAALVGLVRD